MKTVIDSYAWIELLSGTEKGKKVHELIESSGAIYTPDVVFAEIARNFSKKEKTLIP